MTDNVELKRYLNVALSAARKGGDLLLARFEARAQRPEQPRAKSDGSVVSDADITAEQAIVDALISLEGDFGLVSEEAVSDQREGEHTWVIDPLCGTANYLRGSEQWGLNVALRKANELEVAVMTLPAMGLEFCAVRGSGVTLNGEPFTLPTVIEQIGVVILEKSGGRGHKEMVMQEQAWVSDMQQVLTLGSVPSSIVELINGRVSACVFHNFGTVHLAAGAMLCSELGLRVTDADGKDIDWVSPANLPNAVLAHPEFHPKLLAMRKNKEASHGAGNTG
jgi:myo-inositol-1(or 4)-monophosphatase